MAPQVDTTERLLNLIILLRTTSYALTFEQIRHELFPPYPSSHQAARQAFERDKRAIRDMGFIIDSITLGGMNAGTTAYRIDPEKNELPELGLSEEEREVLRIALGMLSIDGSWAGGALAKLGGETDLDGAASMSGSMVIDLHAPVANLPVVVDAAAKRAVLKFSYLGKNRAVHPYGVLARDGHWYVVANDPSVGDLRRFRLDRIEQPEVHGDANAFEKPAGFVLRDHMPDDPKTMNDDPDARDDYAVVLVDASLSKGVERELGADAVVDRLQNGGVKFRVACANRWAFRSWLLGMVDRAEVLEPASVREDVMAWLKGGAK